jgi:beta-fructofuranosidase
MIIGFGIEKINASHGALLLYISADLKKWDFVHLLFEGNPEVDHSGVFGKCRFLKNG